ncbi:ras GEF [Saitoella complicata NRRL Y-17804]|uniref:Uncharacterized protein n=1 Tax=Saitoella complicata (strain BCRC 22490 / CBS 7301 / JCM 7358 / NBRC 10748 / NRRL Y-17804) TaxID=698492 RepID=A0A0E9N797_SAICN|nr:ras GEF [Saitoella complicata NRRL Y-17804]ODQ54356.1 ras GEF [Saitoella complicata NRRL Y-17804]GAO45812.1 hypothetical protein G7K_0062-t1 [Saitoella complicata NRRL Y-17804]
MAQVISEEPQGIAPEEAPVFCRALYDYTSNDASSLNFAAGSVIQVLTQLESGWWDGVLEGERGWFPSNYVQLFAEGELSASEEEGLGDDEVEDDGDGSKDEVEDEAFWIQQSTPDGKTYYYNTVTGNSLWELPTKKERRLSLATTQTLPIVTTLHSPIYDHEDERSGSEGEILLFAAPTTRNGQDGAASSSNRASFASSTGTGASTASSNAQPMSTLATTPGSRPTEGTLSTIAASSSEEDTLRPKGPTAQLLFLDSSTYRTPTLLELHRQVRFSVEKLAKSIELGAKDAFVGDCEEIVDTISTLVLSFDRTDARLRAHHRRIMAALSKLVLSTKIAAGVWPPDDASSKMRSDAAEVLTAAEGFLEAVGVNKMDVRRIKPGFVVGGQVGGGWRGNGIMPNSKQGGLVDTPDMQKPTQDFTGAEMEKLENIAREIQSALKKLQVALVTAPGPGRSAGLGGDDQGLFAGRALMSAQSACQFTRDYLVLIEGLNLTILAQPPRSPTLTDFAQTKQTLYDNNADLLMAAQGLTTGVQPCAPMYPHEGEQRVAAVKQAAKELGKSVQSAVFTLQFLVEEIVMRQNNPQGLPNVAERRKSQLSITSSVIHDPVRDRAGSTGSLVESPTRTSVGSTLSDLEFPRTPKREKGSKLKRFFGDDAPPPAFSEVGSPAKAATPTNGAPRQNIADEPWYLGVEYEHEISYDMKGMVKGGTFVVLVERLTRHDFLDSAFNNTLLLTYRSFTTAEALFDALVGRFNIMAPHGLMQEELDIWVERKQKPIRLRVFNILKSWMETYFMEPKDEERTVQLLDRIKHFAATTMKDHLAGAQVLERLVERRQTSGDASFRKMVLNLTTACPPPILPKNLKRLKFLDVDALELARQLTIIESRLYNKIKPEECLDKNWSKPEGSGGVVAENIKAMILNSNQVTGWVAEAILTQPEIKKRVNLIKHFIAVADKCRQLNNFSTLTAIISGLNSAPIHRLKRTWEMVNARMLQTLESLNKVMNSTKNFSEYREMLHVVNPPCVPFLGVYLTDLTFIEDGNPNMLKKSEHLINFSKRSKTAEVIREIQQYQSVPYSLQPVPELQVFISSNLRESRDVTEMYDLSLNMEPREREDEKIARLLQESGFL